MDETLSGVPETMLIPLWARAFETLRSDPIIRDEKAVEIMEAIDYDFAKFKGARLTQVGVSVRTKLFDQEVSAFLERNPHAIVINLGAGLDTRYKRIGKNAAWWYELDVPESIKIRQRFFTEEEHYRFIGKSMFDRSWMDLIEDEGRPVLLIAEGLFMYFTESELRPLLSDLAERFSGGEVLFEMVAPCLVGKARRHDSLSKMDGTAEFRWSITDSRLLETWHPAIRFMEEWNYFDYCKRRWGLFGVVARLPLIRPRFASRIVRLLFDAEQGKGGTS